MTIQHLSIVIETIAFLLVTIDLYGERLFRLDDQIKTIEIKKPAEILIDLVLKRMPNNTGFLMLMNLLFLTSGIILTMFLWNKIIPQNTLWNSLHLVKYLSITIISLVLTYAGSYLIFLLFYLAVGFSFQFLDRVVWILKKRKIKRLMVISGAILFFFSKYLVW